jgi:alpha-beta hydrolase superfamily lysophospholipase
MAIKDFHPSRRSFLKASVPAVAGGLAALHFPDQALAEPPGVKPGTADVAKVPASKLWSKEYWAQKGDVKLYLFRKRFGAPRPGQAALPVLILVHGSSISSRSSFDLNVPGAGEYSLMNKFAEYGYDVWTLDFEGYGRSSRTAGNSDIASGVADLKAAVEVIARETGQQRYHFFGESSGALRAGAYAMVQPERANRLAFSALTYTGEGSPTLADRAKQLEFYRANNRRPRDRDMIHTIFTRDKEGTSEPVVAEALADAELPFGDSVPTGTYLDMTANLPIVDPLKLHSPVLVTRGEYDGIATEVDLLNFYKKLPNNDRQFINIPGAAHSLVLGTNRHQLWYIMKAFFEMPPRLDSLKPS